MSPVPPPVVNALTVDVEDWFQVSAFEDVAPRDAWDGFERRVEGNTRSLLDLFAEHGVRATFFVLGWVAERHPGLVRAIHAAGHEIASHGHEHRRVTTLSPESFRADLRRAARAIGAAAPVRVRGFRAPSFSFSAETPWAYEVLAEEGYAYSSSVFPVRHDRYGMPDFPRWPVRVRVPGGATLWEFPMTTLRVLGRNLPAAGGGWLRVLPPTVVHRAVSRANAAGHPAILYVHPWEIDPGQPRLAASLAANWRHHVNLRRTRERLAALLEQHAFSTVGDVLAQVAARAQGASPPPVLDLPATTAQEAP